MMLRDLKIKLQSMYVSPTQLCSPAQLFWACCVKVQGLREQRPLFVTCPCDKKAHCLEQEARLSIMTRYHLKTNVNGLVWQATVEFCSPLTNRPGFEAVTWQLHLLG